MSTKTTPTVKERPILMSAPMVRATLRDLDPKTQTRRIIKPQPDGFTVCGAFHEIVSARKVHICPYGKPGDRLWVRECWALEDLPGDGERLIWRADLAAAWRSEPGDIFYLPTAYEPGRWRPSIHMPRWASRITLEVTGVRVERLQDITDDDAEAEGVRSWAESDDGMSMFNAFRIAVPNNPKFLFKLLWTTINGHESWDANPYVWVIEFKRIDQKDTQP